MGIHDGHREKMRRRFLETGLEGFADHEALELLLYYAIPRRDTNPIAHALMERYDSLSGVLNAPVEDLEKVEGIGESAAILLSLVSRLSRKARIADASQETILNSSERAGAYLLERFAGERRELVFLLCLDRKGRLLACKRLAEGDVASADLNIRKVVEMALLTSASAVILAHNHPSGVAVPSSSDEAATRQVAEALRTIGVRLVDHIVVADRDFVSMADSGVLGLITGQIIGRWGNFFNCEAFGGYTDSLFAMRIKRSIVNESMISQELLENLITENGIEYIQVHPTFLYESMWNLGLLLFMLWYRKRKKFTGEMLLIYLTGYGIGRAWIEGLRTDQLLIPGTELAVSQVLSMVIAVISLAVLLFHRRKGPGESEETV